MRLSIFENIEYFLSLVLLNQIRSLQDETETFAINIDEYINQNHKKLQQRITFVIRACV